MARSAAAPVRRGAAAGAAAARSRRRSNGRIALTHTSHAPSSVTSAYDANSSQRVAWFIVAAVALNTTASTATIAIATSAWISADASASSAPLRAVCRLATT
ncbi:hypothetical protein D3C72_1852720 [compost metagenome]